MCKSGAASLVHADVEQVFEYNSRERRHEMPHNFADPAFGTVPNLRWVDPATSGLDRLIGG